MQRSIESDFEDENEICYTSKRRAHPLVQHYDDESLPSSSWTNPNENELEDDQRSSSIDYYQNGEDLEDQIFHLPISSNDLSVTPQQALHLATVYEFLRHFSPILRLSPFLFEHFCTSIIQSNDINNILCSQIHICLLRLLIKQDDDDGITYASETDIKGIIDLSFVTMDYITWPYILQLYVTSHPQLKMLTTIIREYPFHTTVDEKIDVLLALCNVVLTTKTIRREFDDTKPKQHDDNCRQCQKRGDLLCCDRCEATYHLACLNPPLTSVPTVEWFCPVCEQNQVHGVTDCIPPRENRPFYLRHRCVGHDREQRRYWFVCRRLFVEDEIGEDVRYYSTLDQFDALLSCLDERGPEKLLVYRLQKRYNDIARCMQITADLQASSIPLDVSPMTTIIHPALDYVPQLDDEDDDHKSLSMYTDGLMPCRFEAKLIKQIDYEHLLDRIKLKINLNEDTVVMHGQIDGIVDNDDDTNEKETKSMVKKREFFAHSTNNYAYSSEYNGQKHYTNDFSKSNDLIPLKRFHSSNRSLLEERLRHAHNIYSDTEVALRRMNENDIDETIWQRYEQYQTMNRFPSHHRGNTYSNTKTRPYPTIHPSYPRSNYYRDYYTGNNYEDEDGMLLDNEYDDFGDDFFHQEENIDEFDMPFRKYESNRVYRGTTRGRPRGRGRPPLYGGRAGRGSHFGHPPRGVNHLTTGSFQSSQRLIQPKTESPKLHEQQPMRNKRKPAKIKPVTVTTQEEKPRRPGKVLRSGRISRKPRRDSETDFGSDNSDDSGAKDKETGSDDDDDEEFDLTQLGLGFGNTSNVVVKGGRDGSSSSTDSLAGTNRPLTNFAAFAQSQLLSANLANGLIETNEDLSDDSDFSVDGFETDESDDILSEKIKNNSENIDDEELDDFTYSQTMVSLINSIQPSHVKIDLDLVAQNKTNNRNKGDIHPSDGHLHYENSYQTNPLATKKQMLLSERDRRAHLARKFSINNSPSFAWYSSSSSITSNYFLKHLSDILRLTLVYFENTIPLPFMHSHWKRYRYIWARQLLDLDSDLSLAKLIHLLLQFEACIKPVSYFDLFTDQVGYIKFRRETEKERDEAKKEEKDAFIRRKIDADSIIQTVHFTRPLKHSIHKQRGEEYRLAGGQGWTFIRSTRRSIIETKTKKKFDINSLLTRRENMSNVISNERHRIINLLETKLKSDLGSEGNVDNELNNLLLTSKDDNDDFIDDLAFINYKIIDYNGSSYRYPVVSEDTRRPFHLTAATSEKKDLTNPFQLPSPWTFSFDDQIPANIFILPSYILRRLARASMTLIDAPGFINSRLSGIGTRFGWPYPCGRPSVRTAWCYKVQTSTSFFAMAHHIKYLWNCIRWDLITEKLSNIDESSITTHVDNDGIATTIQVLAKRDSGPYDSYCEYFVRRTCHTHTNDPFNFNIPISKSRSRAVPHPSSILTPNRLILTEQWLPERQLQPNQIKYYYQSLLDKSYRRLHKKSNDEKKKSRKPSPLTNSATQQTAKPFIVRIPHLQPKSTLNTESGKVVIVKATGESPSTNLALQQKSFSVVKLADGQIILVPTATVQPNETPVSKIIKAPSPPKSQPQSVSISPQERRLRPIAPAPLMVIPSTNELLNSLLAQQQQQLLLQQQSDTMPHFEAIVTDDTPLTTISETVTINIQGSTAKPTSVVAQRTKNVRKSAPIATASDDKKLKIDPEEGIRLRICEAILRALIGRIEREQNQESMKKRLKNQNTIVQPKSDPRQIVLTRLLNERVDSLRQEFIGNRLNIKTALVKEQVQTQRLKQQQLILKQQQQQQQQATTVKQEDIVSDHEDKKLHTPSPPIPVKKARKSTGNEVKTKRQGTPKTSEQKIKSTQPKRTRPLPPTKTADNDQQPPAKKARRSHVPAPPSEQRESSDNDENLLKNRKTSSSSSTTNTTTTIAKMKSTEKSKKIITIKNSSNKKEKTEINLSDINCSCHRTDTPEKFFIQCEICSRWLHGTCVGLTPRLAEKMKEFICEDCSLLTQKAKERLYCICQKPYEESKFYIGCDVCADWLHGSCVSITPEQAEKFEVYVCPRCSTEKKQEFLNKPINNDIKKDLLTLTDQLLTHKMAWPFQKPVDMKDVPNYYTIIKEPMDLTTLKTKVMNSKFQTICDYIRDVNKIFNNCRLFNPINSTFALCANVVDNYFRQLLENFMVKDDH